MTWQVLTGDVRERLQELPAQSVQCVVTSPPFWGLRDYGTATWEGGDTGCGHAKPAIPHTGLALAAERADGTHRDESGTRAAKEMQPYRSTCGKCGATRIDQQLGLEDSPDRYVAALVEVFQSIRRVLRDDGTVWLNLGDSYASNTKGDTRSPEDLARNSTLGWASGPNTSANQCYRNQGPPRKLEHSLKSKDLVGIPWRVAFALQADGWYLRSDIIWSKPNPMPESVQGSHFDRHMVTVEEYERLSGLPYVDERAGNAWAGHLPRLSEAEVSNREAPLSAEREGYRDNSITGIQRGRAREAETVQSLVKRQTQQGQIRINEQRTNDSAEGDSQVSIQFEGEAGQRAASSTNSRHFDPQESAAEGQQPLSQERERESTLQAAIRPAEGGDSFHDGPVNGSGLAGDRECESGAVLLLQEAAAFDAGSRDSTQQGRTAYKNQRGSGVQSVQFQEAGSTGSPLLVGCPGCDKCIKHHGYTFHLSAGRPTKAHEYLFLLSKKASYYYDAEAIREPNQWADGTGWARDKANRARLHGGKPYDYMLKRGDGSHDNHSKASRITESADSEGRNKRSVWHIATKPYPEAHFATFPEALIEPCILAGTSDKGQCPACGDPWVRVVERSAVIPGGEHGEMGVRRAIKGAGCEMTPLVNDGDRRRSMNGRDWAATAKSETLGWQPSCSCHAGDPIPQTVLDPFTGSGTTGVVAIRHQRNFIGVELNPAYVQLARKRIGSVAPLLAEEVA